ncbi:MAG: ubiquinol-cytochrome c reductase iron-sulfur subunit [Kiloniellales bacterium]|jgi:ubiquinol-cytochrome c reductase iron-sulfur subunit|nr:ubiquinol-cytochrome c reductase iron-sulfur subunit [Kiloniellales bacterium]
MAETATPTHGQGHGGHGGHEDEGETRRDFLTLTAISAGVIGAGIAVWPLINSMNPSADVLALASTEVDLAPIAEGQAVTVIWRGKPIFVRHRTPEEIAEAETVELSELRDPQSDAERTQEPQWLVMVGICTHLGCIPKGQNVGDPKGEYGGWLCPCHGSHYDTSGRIRKGPAPENLAIPPYEFLDESLIRIG